VDPDHDTPPVLADFARRYGADPDRWWFLTGPKPEVYDLIRKRFLLGVQESTSDEQKGGAEAIMHSTRLALVDRGNRVVGYFDSNDERAVRHLVSKAGAIKPPWVHRLPAVNAALNATCALLLFIGWRLIRTGRVSGHVVCMALGVVISALFLTCYIVYHSHVGRVPFQGAGPLRLVYYTILASPSILAVAVVPLVYVTVARALRRRFDLHVAIARVTFPIWMYVSVTGVLVYLLLYQWPVSP